VSTINIFRSITDDVYETIHVEENKPIKEAVEADFTNAVILVNGYRQDENYVLKDGDLCTIRLFPEGDSKDWVTGITIGLGVAFSVLMFWNPGGWATAGFLIGMAVAGGAISGIASAAGFSIHDFLYGGSQQSDLKSPDALASIPQLRAQRTSPIITSLSLLLWGNIFIPPCI
jgi:hypothetical protein